MPHKRYRQKLIDENIAIDEELTKTRQSVEKAIQEALEYAQNSPEPKVEEIMDGLYA